MGRAILHGVYLAAYYLGLFDLFYRFRKSPIVVSYHNIIPDALYDRNSQFIGGDHRESEFDAHLAIIQSKVSITNSLEPGCVLITFDDGYKNNLAIAQPLLQKHGVNATFFVPACYWDSSEMLWIDKMLMWCSYVPPGIYKLCQKEWQINTGADRRATFDALWDCLLENFNQKFTLLEDLDYNYPFSSLEVEETYRSLRFEVLEREDVEALKASGNKVGCHSYNHDILSRLSSEDLHNNFVNCEVHRGQFNVDWFSYPFGRDNEVSDMVVEKCRDFAYSAAFMNIARPSENIYRIPRINMPNSASKAIIHAKLSGFEAALKKVLRRFG